MELLELTEPEARMHSDSKNAKREDAVFTRPDIEYLCVPRSCEHQDEQGDPVQDHDQNGSSPRSLEQRTGSIEVRMVRVCAAIASTLRYSGNVFQQ